MCIIIILFIYQNLIDSINSIHLGVVVLKKYFTSFRISTPFLSEIFPQIYNNSIVRQYLTLQGCAAPERSEIFCLNTVIVNLREYFTLGECDIF